MKTIRELLMTANEKLTQKEVPILDAILLLAYVMGKDSLYIHTNIDEKVDQNIEGIFLEYINLRSKGMPVAYITGIKEFMGLPFQVDSSVLIPRPDTEILAEATIEFASKFDTDLHILDIGTGSGALAIAIAKNIDKCEVFATDISEEAIKIAEENAEQNGVHNKIRFLLGSMYEPVKTHGEKFDIIISNPPYIPDSGIENLQTEIKDYEPLSALKGGKDGFDFYNIIVKEAKEYLIDGGYLLLEAGDNQAKKLADLMGKNNFKNIQIRKDLAGFDRVVIGEFQK